MNEIVLDPPEDFLEARQLTALIGRWLDQLDVAPVTLTTYRHKIKHFTDWWQVKGSSVEWRLTKSLLIEFELHLRSVIAVRYNRPLSYESRRATMRALRMMFKWAANTGRTTKNFGEWVPWPFGAKSSRRSATLSHLADLMFAAGESQRPVRDQAIIAFFIGTGCRRGEVASVLVEGLQMLADGSGTALVDGKHTSANESGRRAVGFDAATGKYLIRYLDVTNKTRGPMWLNRLDTPMTDSGIYQMVDRCIKRAGLSEHIRGPHDLRRTFATILGLMHPGSQAWADMIRRQLGHKHYSMTAHYTLLDVDDIRDNIVTPLALLDNDKSQ